MELSQEAHHLIVRHVGNRRDLLTLCTVSKRFQKEAERALYDTLHLRGYEPTMTMCRLLASTPRLSAVVDALTIFVTDNDDSGSESDDSELSEETEKEIVSVPHGYWEAVAAALRQTTKLRFLSIYFDHIDDTAQSWVLDCCTFQLRTFHCDFEWDAHLCTFLDTQTDLSDLYLADFRPECSKRATTTTSTTSCPSDETTKIDTCLALPQLSILECAFTEAVTALVPGRPVTRVKTCFSRHRVEEKRVELRELCANLSLSKRSVHALDLADESYTPEFTLELLNTTVLTLSRHNNLRYLGTLVLPVESKQRLEFYACLMRFPHLQCVEVEVSDWDPAPMTQAALRALTFELRIYCPTVSTVVFVYDFDRVVTRVTNNVCVLDHEAMADTLWREI